ncbi:uncharacterized protein [Pyxicephalus adspersus]|uniref:uncharacterized protein isoform X3 n=1 Tax=Pyxicephalus adspersus TaxID=30357 RepID=UPI003B5A4467
MEFLFVLGLIGAEIITVGSNDLPAPELSSPSTSVYKDQPPPSTGSTDLTVPLWVIFLVSGLVGFAILVAFVSLIVCLRQRCKQKKQEQRDKESIWINQNMEKDWTLSRNNKVFPIVSSQESTIETELSHPTLSNKNSYSYAGTSTSFSSFRT